MNNLQGWINVYKPLGLSSFAVVKKIKKKFNFNKIGHCGTLDPLAEGILPLAIGKTTKLISFINSEIKEYEFQIKWGEQTSTDDSEGEIINKSNYIPTSLELKKQLKYFQGDMLQKPPKASAVKIKGIRAYKLLRQGKEFDIQEKKVSLYDANLMNSNDIQKPIIKIRCGKGFYIRSFARDLANSLKTKGHVIKLKRTKVGKFEVKNSNLLDDLLKIGQRLHYFKGFHTSVSMLDDILAYEIVDQKDKLCISQGKSIKLCINKLINPSFKKPEEKIIFLKDKGNIVSYGKLNGDLFKPDKVFI